MREIKAGGATIVIVSHSLSQIEQICDRTIWIDGGRIRDGGIPKYVHEHYLNVMECKRLEKIEKSQEKEKKEEKKDTEKNNEKLPSFCSPLSIRIGNRKIKFTDVKLTDCDGKSKSVFKNGESFMVQMEYGSEPVGEGLQANFGIAIYRDDGVHVYGTNTLIEHDSLVDIKKKGKITITIEDNCLLPAKYMLDVAIHSLDGIKYDDIRNIIPFTITANKKDVGICRLDNYWTVDGILLKKREYV